MKVSIITVCFNAELTIEQTIRSVIEQSYQNIEYIIIDGKSSDHTLDIIAKYADKISKVISEPDKGIYDAMNKGIRNATGDIIGILNSDDWYEKDVIKRVVEAFEKNNSQIVHGDVRFIYGDGSSENTVTDTMNKLWYEMVVRHPATFVRREVYQKEGVFDDTFRVAGDYEFILRCYANNVKFYYLNTIVTNFRMTGISNQQEETCFNETNIAALRYVESSPNKEQICSVIYDRMNRHRFSILLKEKADSVQIGYNFSDLFSKKKVFIWGSGEWGKRLSAFLLKNHIDIIAFLDNDANKMGRQINGIEIRRLTTLDKSEYPVLVAIARLDDEMNTTIDRMRQNGFKVILLEEVEEAILKDNRCYMEYRCKY